MIKTKFSNNCVTENDLKRALDHLIESTSPSKIDGRKILKASWLDTVRGPMLAIADENALYLLEFVGRCGLEKEIEKLKQRTRSVIVSGRTKPINLIESELKRFFEGKLTEFKTPIVFCGTFFQTQVWEAIKKIPLGETRSYSDIASAIGKPTAFRAAAQAIGSNQLAIIIPCHRVINMNGKLGGYAGGLAHKEWLLTLEKKI